MPQEFYDVKTKSKVMVDEKKIYKTTFTSETGQVRYGLRGTTADGRPLTKFVSKDTWDSLKVEVQAEVKKPKTEKADKKAPAKKAEAKPEKKAEKKPEKKAEKKPAAKKPAAKKK